ncbi:MAG TPA: hypothetical protein VNZ27_06320 [Rhodanobacter sp.]|jgi:hypothetical protein|nr:hypothetical protein [Rhodanobacter sp.]
MTLLRQILFGIALIAALCLYVWITSHRIDAAEARATAAEADVRTAQAQLAQKQSSDHIVVKYVDRVQVIHERGATITREIPVYVTAQADAACTVPAGFVRVHDAAAANGLPGPAGAADAQPSGLALSAVAGTLVDNYTTCHAVAEQLIALQDWVHVNGQAPTPAIADQERKLQAWLREHSTGAAGSDASP